GGVGGRRAARALGPGGAVGGGSAAGGGAEAGARADRELAGLARLGASLRAWDEPAYPAPLRAIADPPLVLAVLGVLEGALGNDAGAVAVVGARRASSYGKRVAEELACGLAAAGLQVGGALATGI